MNKFETILKHLIEKGMVDSLVYRENQFVTSKAHMIIGERLFNECGISKFDLNKQEIYIKHMVGSDMVEEMIDIDYFYEAVTNNDFHIRVFEFKSGRKLYPIEMVVKKDVDQPVSKMGDLVKSTIEKEKVDTMLDNNISMDSKVEEEKTKDDSPWTDLFNIIPFFNNPDIHDKSYDDLLTDMVNKYCNPINNSVIVAKPSTDIKKDISFGIDLSKVKRDSYEDMMDKLSNVSKGIDGKNFKMDYKPLFESEYKSLFETNYDYIIWYLDIKKTNNELPVFVIEDVYKLYNHINDLYKTKKSLDNTVLQAFRRFNTKTESISEHMDNNSEKEVIQHEELFLKEVVDFLIDYK